MRRKLLVVGFVNRLEPGGATVTDNKTPMHQLVADKDGILPFESRLRHNILKMPAEIRKASGIVVFGRRIKSLLFSTDLAVIKNCDADAIFAVHPFTAQRSISAPIIQSASMPVFCGVGGGTTQGMRAVYLANDAESQGAIGVVVNSPLPNKDIRAMARVLDIPIVATVANERTNVGLRIKSGAAIINVAGGANTPAIVAKIRSQHPKVPIMASGGRTPESILATIDAGANAIVYTPPSSAEMFKELMSKYRDE